MLAQRVNTLWVHVYCQHTDSLRQNESRSNKSCSHYNKNIVSHIFTLVFTGWEKNRRQLSKMVLSLLFDVSALFLFALEFYHVIGHILILTGMRALPRRDLVRQRYYFLVDALTVFTSSFLLTGRMKWLAVIQIIQHMFYFITWDKSYMAKRVRHFRPLPLPCMAIQPKVSVYIFALTWFKTQCAASFHDRVL